jgi:serine/threonine protein kinase
LNIEEPSITYDVDQEVDGSGFSEFAFKSGFLLLARYKIIKVLAENRFGFIYLVERVNKNTKYIIKEFFPHEYVTRNDSDEMILNTPLDIDSLIRFNYMQKFFMGEANNLEKISIKPHPNIIKIASVEKNKNNTSYIVYPYKEGMTLRRFIEIKERMGKQLDHGGLDKIVKPLLDALEHLHSLGILHLNIKLENIFIQENGSLLLSGFEASTFFTDEDSRIFCSAYTLPYAAPEQIDINDFSKIGEQSDIYALGVLLYRLVTGTYPPDAKERMLCKTKDIPYDPYMFLQERKELLEKYDSSLLFAIDKSLMLSRKERFRDIASFRDATLGISKVPEKTPIENKRNFLLYALLLLASIYIVFEGLNQIEKDDTLTATLTSEEIVKDKEKSIQTKVENIAIEKTSKDKKIEHVSYDEDVKVKKIDKNESFEDNEKPIMTPVFKEIVKYEENISKVKMEDKSIDNRYKDKKMEYVSHDEDVKTKEVDIDKNNSKVINTIVKDMILLNTYKIEKSTEKDINVTSQNIVNDISEDKKSIAISNKLKSKNRENEKIKTDLILQKKKRVKKTDKKILKKRKKKVIRKNRINKKIDIQKNRPAKKNSSGLVWYCKAIGGDIRSSARSSDKIRAKNIALSKCRRRAGLKKQCRILNCFLVR